MQNSRWLKPEFDLIEEIRKVTINATNFNPDEWCEYDANILDRAAKMIRREIADESNRKFRSMPIAPTPVLEGENAERFIREVKANENIPSYPCGDPEKLEQARQKWIKERRTSMKIKIDKTTRGFRRADFIDLYNEQCSIQESSLATDDAIWFGCNEGTHHLDECMARMHLNKEQVAALLPLLQHFVKTGRLPDS
jgi:hypothetical protein